MGILEGLDKVSKMNPVYQGLKWAAGKFNQSAGDGKKDVIKKAMEKAKPAPKAPEEIKYYRSKGKLVPAKPVNQQTREDLEAL